MDGPYRQGGARTASDIADAIVTRWRDAGIAHAPATAFDLAVAEARIGRTLPSVLRHILQRSDGSEMDPAQIAFKSCATIELERDRVVFADWMIDALAYAVARDGAVDQMSHPPTCVAYSIDALCETYAFRDPIDAFGLRADPTPSTWLSALERDVVLNAIAEETRGATRAELLVQVDGVLVERRHWHGFGFSTRLVLPPLRLRAFDLDLAGPVVVSPDLDGPVQTMVFVRDGALRTVEAFSDTTQWNAPISRYRLRR